MQPDIFFYFYYECLHEENTINTMADKVFLKYFEFRVKSPVTHFCLPLVTNILKTREKGKCSTVWTIVTLSSTSIQTLISSTRNHSKVTDLQTQEHNMSWTKKQNPGWLKNTKLEKVQKVFYHCTFNHWGWTQKQKRS